MGSNLRHCFIRAPIEEVRSAWSDWSHGNLGVSFIPAQGGCFVVQIRNAAPSPLMLLKELSNGQANVLKFKADFENRLEEMRRDIGGVGQAALATPRSRLR